MSEELNKTIIELATKIHMVTPKNDADKLLMGATFNKSLELAKVLVEHEQISQEAVDALSSAISEFELSPTEESLNQVKDIINSKSE